MIKISNELFFLCFKDLKALNLMLNAQPFQFVIDLAVVSSRYGK